MTAEMSLFAAFMVGLLGSAHCIGMCGGVVGALTMGLPESIRHSYWRLFPYLFTYNLGRIISYTVAGILVGYLGAKFAETLPMDNPRKIAMWVSGIFMILLGLYLGGWWKFLVIFEKWGGHIWKRIEPFGRKLMPVKNVGHAFLMGLLWGWLPCGLVYGVLAFALTSGSATNGGLLMLAFGLGTLPMLFAVGIAVNWLIEFTRHPRVQQTAGAIVIVFGLFTIFGPHHHHMKHGHGMHKESHEMEMSHEKSEHHHHDMKHHEHMMQHDVATPTTH